MRKLTRLALGAGAVLGLSAWVAPVAGAEGPPPGGDFGGGGDHAVFVQTDNTAGNQIVAYHRNHDGTLTLADTYATGGSGGVLNGSVVDHLGSQGSLASDPAHGLLYAVNAGSNTVSVFSVYGDQLDRRQVVGSGGTFPVSIAVHGNLVYVLNAENGGSVSGYWVTGDRLQRIWGSTRSLGLTIPTDTTQFTHTPGQVAFTPDGSQLVVTTKATTSAIDVFSVGWDGRLASPTVNVEPGTVPFAVTFDRAGRLVVADAGTNAVSTYWLHGDGTASFLNTVATGKLATCWIVQARGYLFASNAGSGDLSTLRSGPLTLLGATATDAGTVDAATTPWGQFLYVQTGKLGIVDEFSVAPSGALSEIGSVTVPGAVGGEGIVAL